MPGNGVGDRVHNFFAQENLRSQDENWSLDDNLWVGNQKQFGVSDSSPRNFNSQQSETERGHGGQRVPDQYGFNITQTNASSNGGYIYGRQNFQTRPDEANFMGVNTEYEQNNVNQRVLQQEHVLQQPQKNPVRSDSSEAHGSFDLFGGQHQTNSQYPGLLQQGFSDTQHLQQQQQLMLRRMQEIQRQQNALNQASQLARQQEIQKQQNMINQASQFARQQEIQKQQNALNQASQFARQQEIQRQQNSLNQASQFARQQGSGSHSHGFVNGWTEPAGANRNWLHHAEPSLPGVPVNQFPHNNSLTFGNTFSQGSNSRMKMDHVQKINPSVQESPVEVVQDKSGVDAAPLDPEEEKILFGSDDNIWEAFGSKNMTGGVSSLLDDNEFGSGLPSLQSGSWSALMQSAAAETTSGNLQKTDSVPVPGHRTPQQHSAQSMNSGFNMNENGDWKRLNTAAIPHSNHNLNYWKHVDSSVNNNKGPGPQVSESSFNSSDKEDLNSSRKENSNDSYRSSSSHFGQREHLLSDAGDSRSKQSLSNQAGRKISGPGPGPGPHKFQYHPMGNLDDDVGVPVSLQHSRVTKSSNQVGSDDMRFKGMVPGHPPNIFAPHDRSDKASQPSQNKNMLELLHKVDQSRKLNSLEHNMSSEIPEPENSDGSFGGQQRSQSSNSQGIGLQLGPPSQRLPIAIQAVKHNSLTQSQPSANSRGKSHAELSPFPTYQDRMSMSSQSQSQSQSQTTGNKMMTNLSTALGGTVFPNSRNHLQNHPTTRNESFDEQGAVPRSQQVFSASQPGKSQYNIVESTSLGQQNLEDQELEKRGNKSSVGERSTEKVDRVDRGQLTNGPAAGNDSTTSSQKDLEAFGRSLKPNTFHQQISLMNQTKAYKHTDNDPNNRVLKRLKESDNLLPRSTFSTDNVDQSLASLPANPPFKDALISNQNVPTVKIENSHISPQMAPSWFDRYGTLKSGQMSSQRVEPPKEPPASVAAVPSTVVVDRQLDSHPLQPNIGVQSLVTVKPKKRKWSRHDIRSWLKEVSGSSKNLQGIWTASMEWCGATRRLMEKVDDDGELTEDAPRPKRRVILTTQLMQQLFPPPPPALLLTEAALNYETVAFYASRLALGDACNLVSCVSHRKSNLIHYKTKESEKTEDKSKELEKIDDSRLLETVEDCTSKGKRVESDFSRLDKRASILDLRLEIQDIEKFSMINRFAKYHGRGQADGESSSSSSSLSDKTPNASRSFPQRYVIAVPLPKNLPESVQCLSL